MSDVFDFLSISFISAQFLDEKGWWSWLDWNFGSSVLAFQLNHDSNSFPLSTFLDDIFTDFLGILNKLKITKPRGPNLGARVAAGPGSPPKTLILTKLDDGFTKSDLSGINFGRHCMAKIIKLLKININPYFESNEMNQYCSKQILHRFHYSLFLLTNLKKIFILKPLAVIWIDKIIRSGLIEENPIVTVWSGLKHIWINIREAQNWTGKNDCRTRLLRPFNSKRIMKIHPKMIELVTECKFIKCKELQTDIWISILKSRNINKS